MIVRILTFGPLTAHLKSQQIAIPKQFTLDELNQLLRQNFPAIQRYPYIFAINKQIVNQMDIPINQGDEIALLPPFSGG